MSKEYEDKLAEKDKEICVYEIVLAKKNKEIEELKRTSKFFYEKVEEYRLAKLMLELKNEVLLLRDNMIHFGERLKLVNDTKHRVCEEIGQTLDEYIDTHRWQWENKGRHEIVKIPNCVIREILMKIEKGE